MCWTDACGAFICLVPGLLSSVKVQSHLQAYMQFLRSSRCSATVTVCGKGWLQVQYGAWSVFSHLPVL